jgi:hypothetical protein
VLHHCSDKKPILLHQHQLLSISWAFFFLVTSNPGSEFAISQRSLCIILSNLLFYFCTIKTLARPILQSSIIYFYCSTCHKSIPHWSKSYVLDPPCVIFLTSLLYNILCGQLFLSRSRRFILTKVLKLRWEFKKKARRSQYCYEKTRITWQISN